MRCCPVWDVATRTVKREIAGSGPLNSSKSRRVEVREKPVRSAVERVPKLSDQVQDSIDSRTARYCCWQALDRTPLARRI